jgi:hypothetical protein
MRKLTLVSIVLSILCVSVKAQKNLQPGFVVKINGDTLRGLIDYRNWIQNPNEISFQKDQNSTKEIFAVTGINYFEVTGKDSYKSFGVLKDMTPVTLSHLTREGEERKLKDTAFLRILVKGNKLSLYELVDEKTHYFLQEGNSELLEMPYKVFYDKNDPSVVVTLNTFRDQLKSYALDNEKLISRINRAAYKEKDLVPIVIALDNSSAVINEQPKQKGSQFFAGASATYNNIVFSGGDNYQNINDLKASTHLSYALKAGIDVFSKRRFHNLVLRLEAAYSTYNYDGKMERDIPFVGQHEKRNYKIQINSFTSRFFVNYTVYKTSNIKVYGGAGAGYNFSSYPENVMTIENETTGSKETKNEFLDFEKAWIEINIQGGILYRNFDISIGTRATGNFANYTYLRPKFYTSGLTVSYRFGK